MILESDSFSSQSTEQGRASYERLLDTYFTETRRNPPRRIKSQVAWQVVSSALLLGIVERLRRVGDTIRLLLARLSLLAIQRFLHRLLPSVRGKEVRTVELFVEQGNQQQMYSSFDTLLYELRFICLLWIQYTLIACISRNEAYRKLQN